MVSFIYGRAKSTTSRCFHRVLRAIVALESYYIQQPKGDVVPKEIQEKKRFYPYFKNCVGAIDRTHVCVKVPNRDSPRYRDRKGYPVINVLAACSFDLKFTYVLTGWEGTASDSRIVKDTLKRDDKLLIPRDKDRDKKLKYEVLQEVLDEQPQQVRHDVNNGRVRNDGAKELRNTITTQMWNDYLLKPNNEIDMSN
ncbi:uncharacterized protein LOC111894331 [Lactuca sativa]|nr:uncharacterized protein LOC111894331 [Lactuca sativa]